MRHFFEEPPISPKGVGSGAVFFSNCNLKCIFCQNHSISHFGIGKDFSEAELLNIFKKVESSGCANLNLVTPTHYFSSIVRVLQKLKSKIPVVWNTSGYENPQNIKKLAGLVDVFLFDAKYFDDELAKKFSKAPNYFENCQNSLVEARKIVPTDIVENGVMKKGIVVRLLVLPNHADDSINILKAIKQKLGTNIFVSIMSQYVPCHQAVGSSDIGRRVLPLEYKKVVACAKNLGFKKGFVQDFSSANECFTPDFEHNFFEL